MSFWMTAQGLAPEQWRSWIEHVRLWMADVPTMHVREFREGLACLRWIEYDYGDCDEETGRPEPEKLAKGIALSGWIKDRTDGASCTDRDATAFVRETIHESTVSKWVGEFSLAQVASDHLALVTDVYATRPVYYLFDGARFLAANDLRLLLISGLVPLDLREEACLSYLLMSSMIGENEISDNQTFFRHIQKVPPATVLRLDSGSLSARRYFGFSDLLGDVIDDVDHVSEFRSLMNGVTQDRIRASRSTLHLSGGLDSSTILAAVKELGESDRVSAVNMSFQDEELAIGQDYRIAKGLMHDLGIPGAVIWGDGFLRIPNAAIDNDPLSFTDGPDPSANPLAKEAIAHFMLSVGSKQAVTGESGDVVLGEQIGLLVCDSLIRAGLWNDVVRMMGRSAHGSAVHALTNAFRHAVSPWIPWVRDRFYYLNCWHEHTLPPIPHYFSPRLQELERQDRRRYYQPFRLHSPHRLLGHRYMQDFLWPRAAYFDSINSYAPHSHPFLDRRLMEFVFRAPTHIHCDYRNMHLGSYAATKMLARRAYDGVLPDYARLKQTKTSYAHMARKMLLNSKADLLSLFNEHRLMTRELELIEPGTFWKHLVATLLKAEDPNDDLGVLYHYLRGVIDLEIWLRNVCGPVEHLRMRSRLRKPRPIAETELV